MMLVLVSGSGGGAGGAAACHWTCRSCYLPTGRLAVDQHFHITPHHHTPHSTGYTQPPHLTLARVCPGWPRQCGGRSDPALARALVRRSGEEEAPPRPPPGERRWNFPWRNISWQIVIQCKYFYPPPHQQWENNSNHKLQVKRLMKIGTCCILSGDFQVYCFRIEMEDNI